MTALYDIVDIGANLAHRSFNGDRKAVIQRAFAAGVRTLIITGTSQASSQEAQRIAREYPGQLFSTAGVHPHDITLYCGELGGRKLGGSSKPSALAMACQPPGKSFRTGKAG